MPQEHGFKLERTESVPDYNGKLSIFSHPSGLQVYALKNDSKDCSFNYTFRTPATNDRGITHILEHCVLAGSQKFPAHDPFFQYMKSSPNTFMNAFTAADSTSYLASSFNDTDLANLFRIYSDAVFNPLLRDETIWQEGFRYQYQQGQLEPVGVVFNEMKAYTAQNDYHSYLATRSKLFEPSETYHYRSGGVPIEIMDVTPDQIRDYHQQYYQPDNCILTLYGDVNVEQLLSIAAEALSRKQLSNDSAKINFVSSIETKQLSEHQEPIQLLTGRELDQSRIGLLAFRGPNHPDLDQAIDFQVLERYLLENDHSPLAAMLRQDKYGHAPWQYNSIDIDDSVTSFLGVVGTTKQQLDKLRSDLVAKLEQIERSGLDSDEQAYIYKQTAISIRSYKPAHQVSSIMTKAWLRNLDIVAAMNISDQLDSLKQRMREQNYLAVSIDGLFLNPLRSVNMIMEPQPDYLEVTNRQLYTKAESIGAQIDTATIERIKQQNEQLTELQQNDQSDNLPEFNSELFAMPEVETEPQKIVLDNSATILYNNLPTKELVYQTLLIDLSKLELSQAKYLPLYLELLGRSGVAGQSAADTVARMRREVAQFLKADVQLVASQTAPQENYRLLTMSYRSLARDVDAASAIIHDYLTRPVLTDQQLLTDIVKELHRDAVAEATYNGHRTSMSYGAAQLSDIAKWSDLISGVEYVNTSSQLLSQLSEPETIVSKLEELQKMLSNQPRQLSFTTSNPADEYVLSPSNQLDLDHRNISSGNQTLYPAQSPAAIRIDSEVNYVSQSWPAVGLTHPLAPALAVLQHLLRGDYLHQQIREKGGAYGAGAKYNSGDHTFSMYSYRDPQLEATLDTFDQAIAWTGSGGFNETQLDQAKCSVIGRLDAPKPPASYGLLKTMRTITGFSPVMYHTFRDGVLQVNADDIIRASSELLGGQTGQITVLAAKDADVPSDWQDLELK